jgi:NAD(P)-dependent dehydrogenase (short-subunit alcohol dehydrogenase family)
MGTGDMMSALSKAIDTNPQLANMVTPFLPDYIAQPEDIADAACWLASDESRFVTASSVAVDLGSTQY